MGWDGTYVPLPATEAAAIEYVKKEELDGSSVVAANAVRGREGWEVYLAYRIVAGVIGVVVLLEGDAGNTMAKLMDESTGPFFWDANAEVMMALDPLEKIFPQAHRDTLKSAGAWRAKCFKRLGINPGQMEMKFEGG